MGTRSAPRRPRSDTAVARPTPALQGPAGGLPCVPVPTAQRLWCLPGDATPLHCEPAASAILQCAGTAHVDDRWPRAHASPAPRALSPAHARARRHDHRPLCEVGAVVSRSLPRQLPPIPGGRTRLSPWSSTAPLVRHQTERPPRRHGSSRAHGPASRPQESRARLRHRCGLSCRGGRTEVASTPRQGGVMTTAADQQLNWMKLRYAGRCCS